MLQEVVPKALETAIMDKWRSQKTSGSHALTVWLHMSDTTSAPEGGPKDPTTKSRMSERNYGYGNEEHPFTLIRYMSINYVYLLSSKKREEPNRLHTNQIGLCLDHIDGILIRISILR